MYSPAWSHGKIKEIFSNIFMVSGTNITRHDNVELQHSRNMVIVRNENKLSLINTVRLSDEGLAELDKLGSVENIISIGAFHGRDDAFYLDRYHSKLWALKGMKPANNKQENVELIPNEQMPFPKSSLFIFETSVHPEGIIYIAQEDGILITCDSIKNWAAPDEFFSAETAKLYEEQGLFGVASISNIWKQATQVKSSDFARLKRLKFRHLISAHGEPLLHNAHELVSKTILETFDI